MLRRWSCLILCLLTVSLRVAGQGSNVTTCVPDYAWSINNLNQTPCLVASYLESLCGIRLIVFQTARIIWDRKLSPKQTLVNAAVLHIVQSVPVEGVKGGRSRTGLHGAKIVRRFPKDIPEEVQVPEWMKINVTLTGNNFDPLIAQQVGQGTPAPTSLIPQLSSSSIPSASSPTSIIDSPTQIPEVAPSTKKSNAGAIAGGVVAGLVVIVLIILFVLWKIIRQRRNAVQKDFSFNRKALVSGTNVTSHPTGTSGITSGATGVTPMTTGVSYYSPDGPSPIPYGGQSLYATSEYRSAYSMSPTASSAMYTTPPERRSLESISPSMVQLGTYQPQRTQPLGFRGAAELS
ncbi:hypothetical protein JR316_0003189 [Psilocybe cubensis]|uniref:Uncharacterized protein n=2 Tax=Psilocybe cubensis TaxID=181762 RepID=A0ACB8H709_PSICU|nr:hypothetical protein JR316_0003189 [Psilocybe cubensis]KAH9483713.1 hypothetical protein JR316_0003189 [Psilocybe cubensis]